MKRLLQIAQQSLRLLVVVMAVGTVSAWGQRTAPPSEAARQTSPPAAPAGQKAEPRKEAPPAEPSATPRVAPSGDSSAPAAERRRFKMEGMKRRSKMHHGRMGEWLRRYHTMTPEEQEKALAEDAHFQRLSPERQAKLRERLRRFSALPQEEKQRILDRMAKFGELDERQRAHLRRMQDALHALPMERQTAVRGAFRRLMQMPPEERKRSLQSAEMRERFSESEIGILDGLVAPPPSEEL